MGGSVDVLKGEDQHGWHANAVAVAMDKVRQHKSSQMGYLRGMRPFEALKLKRNGGGIVPFGVNSMGGQFVGEPYMSSKGELRGELRGGIMFTKAGQDYIQELLNRRQSEYAEMGARTVRESSSAYTDPTLANALLATVYPLYDNLMDDLRTLTVKSASTFNAWWSMMLAVMPQLGSNYRSNLLEMADNLGDTYNGAKEQVERMRGDKTMLQLTSVGSRIMKAIAVIREYCGSALTNQPAPIDLPAPSLIKTPERVRNPKTGELEPYEYGAVPAMPFSGVKGALPAQEAGITASEVSRGTLLAEINRRIGVSLAPAMLRRTEAVVERIVVGEAMELNPDEFEVVEGIQEATRAERADEAQNAPTVAPERRRRTGRLANQPAVGTRAREGSRGVAQFMEQNLQAPTAPTNEVVGEGRRPRRVARHHRIKNALNE
jgi:hypothetical protein